MSALALIQNVDWNLLFVRTVNFLQYYFQIISAQTIKTSKFIYNSFGENTYVFFEGSDIPVRLEDYKQSAVGTPPVVAFYDRDKKMIYTNRSCTTPHTLFIDSAKIYYNDVCMYDITDFFETISYCGDRHVPSLQVWIGVWCLEKGIYLDRKKDFKVSCVFMDNSEHSFPIWSTTKEMLDSWDSCTCLPEPIHRQAAAAEPTAAESTSAPAPASEETISDAADVQPKKRAKSSYDLWNGCEDLSGVNVSDITNTIEDSQPKELHNKVE